MPKDIPKLVPLEYTPPGSTDVWKIEKFEWLANEFVVRRDQLALFHATACRFEKPWRIVRMLYGINPVVMPIDCDADYMKVLSRFEIAVKLGLDADLLEDQLDIILQVWRTATRYDEPKEIPAEEPKQAATPTAPVPVAKPQPPPQPKAAKPKAVTRKIKEATSGGAEVITKIAPIQLPELENAAHAELLQRYGFADDTFGDSERDIQLAEAERQWFILRLIDLQKLFDEPAVATLARQALLSEVFMRRLDAKMCLEEVESAKFAHLQEIKNGIESQYAKTWDKITGIVPWATQVGNKIGFAGVLSDIVLGVREFMARVDNKIIDGIRTALEIQVEMRSSVQHEIRYRPGQTAALVEAKANLWDPDFERSIPDHICRMLDEGMREGAKRVREEAGIDLPDLEDDGPKGEYPPLFVVPEAEEPKENIPIA